MMPTMDLDLHVIAGKAVLGLDRRNQSPSSRRAQRIVNIPIQLGAFGTPLTVGQQIVFRLSLGGAATWVGWSLAGLVTNSDPLVMGGMVFDGQAQLTLHAGSTMALAMAQPLIPDITPTNIIALTPGLSLGEITEQPIAPDWTNIIYDPSWLICTVVVADGVIEVLSLTLQVVV